MSLTKSAVLAGSMMLALAGGAAAQGAAEPWDLKERSAYVMMMDGSMKVVALNDRGMSAIMKRAKPVPRGTAFIMSNGRLYMVTGKMFDRAGNFMLGL